MKTIATIALMLAMITAASAQQDESKSLDETQISCIGVMASRRGIYFFKDKPNNPILSSDPNEPYLCDGAAILPNEKGCWPIKGKSLKQILRVCKIGMTCQITGVLKNLTHGLYCWTQVNSVGHMID
jgi:hypothetical protein